MPAHCIGTVGTRLHRETRGVSGTKDVVLCLLLNVFIYKYIVVVVERSILCGQVHFPVVWQALAWRQTLCAARGSRCSANGDKYRRQPFSVDNRVVVPAIPPKLCTRSGRCVEKSPHRWAFPPGAPLRPPLWGRLQPGDGLSDRAASRSARCASASRLAPAIDLPGEEPSAACEGHGQFFPLGRVPCDVQGVEIPFREAAGKSKVSASGFACCSLIAL